MSISTDPTIPDETTTDPSRNRRTRQETALFITGATCQFAMLVFALAVHDWLIRGGFAALAIIMIVWLLLAYGFRSLAQLLVSAILSGAFFLAFLITIALNSGHSGQQHSSPVPVVTSSEAATDTSELDTSEPPVTTTDDTAETPEPSEPTTESSAVSSTPTTTTAPTSSARPTRRTRPTAPQTTAVPPPSDPFPTEQPQQVVTQDQTPFEAPPVEPVPASTVESVPPSTIDPPSTPPTTPSPSDAFPATS